MEYTAEYLTTLQKYEKANPNVQYIEDGSEPKELWMNWGFIDSEPNPKSRLIKEWDNWYLNLQDPGASTQTIDQEPMKMNFEIEENFQEKEDITIIDPNKPLLFLHPNPVEPLGIFDFEDLGDENLCVLCKNEEFVKKVFIWKGLEFVGDNREEEMFVEEVIKNLWGEINLEELVIIKEMANNESEEFMDCFQ